VKPKKEREGGESFLTVPAHRNPSSYRLRCAILATRCFQAYRVPSMSALHHRERARIRQLNESLDTAG
jgi:hypothetical protein